MLHTWSGWPLGAVDGVDQVNQPQHDAAQYCAEDQPGKSHREAENQGRGLVKPTDTDKYAKKGQGG
jgi:hypothetical protein